MRYSRGADLRSAGDGILRMPVSSSAESSRIQGILNRQTGGLTHSHVANGKIARRTHRAAQREPSLSAAAPSAGRRNARGGISRGHGGTGGIGSEISKGFSAARQSHRAIAADWKNPANHFARAAPRHRECGGGRTVRTNQAWRAALWSRRVRYERWRRRDDLCSRTLCRRTSRSSRFHRFFNHQ